MSEDLTRAEAHFAFGKNWAAYAEKIAESEIAEAENGLRRLVRVSEAVVLGIDVIEPCAV